MSYLFPIAYLPPVSYLVKCQQGGVLIEQHEHFVKQTIRNRCSIYGPNGLQLLVIPVVHKDLFRTPVKDVLISYESGWNRIHWKSITSAYRNAPYFEFYEDQFRELFEDPPEKLFDFNISLLETIFRFLKMGNEIRFTTEFEKSSGLIDLRDNSFQNELLPAYHQVFQDRHGFIRNLSVIDLIFNTGPDAIFFFGKK